MSNDSETLLHLKTDGGILARHRLRETTPIFVGPSTSNELNTIRPALAPVACLRVDDIRFEFDSSFISPQAKIELKLLAQLRKDSPGILASVFGHADPVGNDVYNKQLSGRRSAAVYGLLTNNVAIWEDIYSQKGQFTNPVVGDKWGIDAIQIMLTTLGFYAGPINGNLDGPTRASVEAFQRSPDGAGLNPDGDPGPKTREKLFLAYMKKVCVDASETPFVMDKSEFLAGGVDPQGKGDYQGCSEFNPVLLFSQTENAAFQSPATHPERNRQNQPNRRVLLFFFRPNSRITPNKWPCPRVKEGVAGCHARFFSDGEKRRSFGALRREYKNTKDTFACRFYDRLAVESPCEIGPPLQVNRLQVKLKLVWKDPDPAAPAHVFPEDFPVVVVFGDGSTEPKKIGKEGKLEFEVERSKRSFTLNFDFSEKLYLATATPATTGPGPERFVAESAAKAAIDDHYRVFSLPLNAGRRWELADWDWKAEGVGTTAGGAPVFNNNEFQNLQDVSVNVGDEAAPVVMTLDPHWQYLRFEYFDRFFGHANHGSKRIGVRPLVIEGFRAAPASGTPPPDTRSNWVVSETDDEKRCQALPWILRRKADKTPEAKPDASVLIQLRSAPGTFIQCTDAATREVITTGGAPASTDPGLNVGKTSNLNLNLPNSERLKFYDLPVFWKSQKYFAVPPSGTGKFFENLTAEIPDSANNDPAKMLKFSLDDIVLCRPGGGNQPTPLTMNPASDRVAIFSHLFNKDPANAKVNAQGVYDPDPAQPYFSRNVPLLPNINYINDYPNWTRLVIMRGNLFDVFDQRLPNVAGQTVGARAGMMWIDATQAPNYTAVGNNMANRPLPTRRPFFSIQPFFEERNLRGTHVGPDTEEGTGRFDLALIRCCDDDAGKEVAVCMNYFRFAFNFNPPANTAQGLTPSGLTGAAATQFATNASVNIPQRWNGPDPAPGGPTYPPCSVARAQIESKTGTPALRVETMWFAQTFPNATGVHFSMNVFQRSRAFMGSFDGSGQLSIGDDAPYTTTANPPNPGFPLGAFTMAHECGHGGGLGDEYVEASFSASYGQEGFYYNTPGSPFSTDTRMMMCNDMRVISPRHFWHLAEWVRFLENNNADYQVKHSGFTFELPHVAVAAPQVVAKPYMYTHYHWPLDDKRGLSLGTRGRFDEFLYPLGEELFTTQVLAPGKGTMGGQLIVVVKMKFTFHFTTHNDIVNALGLIRSNIDFVFNQTNKWQIAGTAKGVTFTKDNKPCILRFVPRFLVTTFSGNAQYAQSVGIPNTTAAYNQRVNGIEANHPRHFHVTTKATGASSFTGTHDLSLQLPTPLPPVINFSQFFAQMIGINPAAINQAASYVPLVRLTIPNGQVFPL